MFEQGTLENSVSETHGGAFGISTGSEAGFIGIAVGRYDTSYGVPAAHHEHGDDAEEEASEHGHDLRIDMRQDRYDLKAERVLNFGVWERARLRASYDDYEHRELEGSETGTRFEQNGLEIRGNLDHGEIASWRGTLGVQYVETDFEARGDEAFVPPSMTRQVAVFAFEKREFGAVAVELGARAENQRIDPRGLDRSYDETANSLSAGLVWSFANSYSLATNLTRSQRHPQSVELYANGPHLAISRFEIGTPSLKKEIANTIDLTLHRHGESGAHWSVSAFRNDFANFIYAMDTGEGVEALPVFRYTQADAELYGLEAEITVPLFESGDRRFEMRLASDYVRGRLDHGGDLPQMPPLRYGIELHYERGPLHMGAETYHHARQDKIGSNERETGRYTLLGVDVSYRLAFGNNTVLMFLRGTNLLDEDARRHPSPLKEIAPLPGRSLHAGVRAEF